MWFSDLNVDGQSIRMDSRTLACKRLWSAAFLSGLRDAANDFTLFTKARVKGSEVKEDHYEALRWMNSDFCEPGSFAWLCELHDMEPKRIRAAWRLNLREILRGKE